MDEAAHQLAHGDINRKKLCAFLGMSNVAKLGLMRLPWLSVANVGGDTSEVMV